MAEPRLTGLSTDRFVGFQLQESESKFMSRCKVLAKQVQGFASKVAALNADHNADLDKIRKTKEELATQKARKAELTDAMGKYRADTKQLREESTRAGDAVEETQSDQLTAAQAQIAKLELEVNKYSLGASR